METVQKNLQLKLERFPESTLKKLTAQPMSGSSVTTINAGTSTQTRIEIPSCVERPDLLEVGYQFALNGGAPFLSEPGVLGGADRVQYFTPANYMPDWQRIEIFHADSTNKLFELTNVHKYSRMVSSLFNNSDKRSLNQRVNFRRDAASCVIGRSNNNQVLIGGAAANHTYLLPSENISNGTLGTNVPTKISNSVSINNPGDGFLNDFDSLAGSAIKISPVGDTQQEYLPLGYLYPTDATNHLIWYQPYTFNFNFRLGDILHDSWLNLAKHHYHSSNLVIIIYWNPISEIVAAMDYTTSTADGVSFAANTPVKNGPLRQYSGSQNVQIKNFFARYYSEQNASIITLMKSLTYEIAYPFIYQTNLSLASVGQIGANLMIGMEGDNRIYRIYTALFGMNSQAGRFLSDNASNLGYDVPFVGANPSSTFKGKWSGRQELYINNDLISSVSADYGDWYQEMACFRDSSLKSKPELDYLGTLAWNLDSSTDCGRKWEYEANTMKGKMTSEQVNINPRYINTQTDSDDNPTGNYTQYIFGVIMRRGIIRSGVFSTM
jgi:hypothetical protein